MRAVVPVDPSFILHQINATLKKNDEIIGIYNVKIRIHSKEHSKKVQRLLHKLGASWSTSYEMMHLDKPYLFVHKSLVISYADNLNYFLVHSYKEIYLNSNETFCFGSPGMEKIEKLEEW